jgi:hypothetical protein
MDTPAVKPPKAKRTRSPSYPSFNLREAIEKARAFWNSEKRHPAPIDAVARDWNYEPKSSAVMLAVAALKKYGLLDDVGSGSQRQVKLTDSALKILLGAEGSPELEAEIKAAALRPTLHRELWTLYGEELPSDATLKSWLLLQKKFNPAVVEEFIKIYKQTISFAKLTSADIIPDTDAEQPKDKPTSPDPLFGKPFSFRPMSSSAGGGAKPEPHMTADVRYLPIPLDIGNAPIPVGMSEDDFQLLLDTLRLWKKNIVLEPDKEPEAKGEKPRKAKDSASAVLD